MVLLLAEETARLENRLHHLLVLVIQKESRLQSFNLRLEKAERVGIGDLEADADVGGQLLIRLAQLFLAVRVRAVLAEVALLLLLEVLAHLSFVIVVGDVEHLVLHFDGQLL